MLKQVPLLFATRRTLPSGADEERPPPTSFFRKYWHIILPLALLLLTTGEPEPTKVTKVAEKSD